MERSCKIKASSSQDYYSAWSMVLARFEQADELARFSLVSKTWHRICNQVPILTLDLDRAKLAAEPGEIDPSTIEDESERQRARQAKLNEEAENLVAVLRSVFRRRTGVAELTIISESHPLRVTPDELMNKVLAPSCGSTLQKLLLRAKLSGWKGFFQSIPQGFASLRHLEMKEFQYPDSDQFAKMRPATAQQHTLGATNIRVLGIKHMIGKGSVQTILNACPHLEELYVGGPPGISAGLTGGLKLGVNSERSFEAVRLAPPGLPKLTSGTIPPVPPPIAIPPVPPPIATRAPVVTRTRGPEGPELVSGNNTVRLDDINSLETYLREHPELEKLEVKLTPGLLKVDRCANLSILRLSKGFTNFLKHGATVQVTGCGQLKELYVRDVDKLEIDEESVSQLEILHLCHVNEIVLPKSLPCLKGLLVNEYIDGDINTTVLEAAGSCLVELVPDWEKVFCIAVAEWIGKPAKRVNFFPASDFNTWTESLVEGELQIEMGYGVEDAGPKMLKGIPGRMMERMEGVEEIRLSRILHDDEENESDENDEGEDSKDDKDDKEDVDEDDKDGAEEIEDEDEKDDEDESDSDDEKQALEFLMKDVRPGFRVVKEKWDLVFRRS